MFFNRCHSAEQSAAKGSRNISCIINQMGSHMLYSYPPGIVVHCEYIGLGIGFHYIKKQKKQKNQKKPRNTVTYDSSKSSGGTKNISDSSNFPALTSQNICCGKCLSGYLKVTCANFIRGSFTLNIFHHSSLWVSLRPQKPH